MRAPTADRIPARIALVAAVCATLTLLTLGAVPTAGAAFSGHNGRIAFSANRHGVVDIYSIQPNGLGERNLTRDAAPDFEPAWSPDGHIAYTSLHTGDSNFQQIWLMTAQGTEKAPLTHLTDGNAESPAWSPDGTQIAFAEQFGGAIDSEIFTMKADGSNIQQLTDNTSDDSDPAWSPDGQRLAFVRNARIETMKTNGTDLQPLTPAGMSAFDPAWAPSGDVLAFSGHSSGSTKNDLYTINAGGTGLTRLTQTGKYDEVMPSCSPDGRRIAYVSERVHGESDVQEDTILTTRMNGTGTFALTTQPKFLNRWPDWRTLP